MTTRRVVVTGANKGIGKATVAAILGAADDTMVLLGSRDLGRGEAAVADILAEQPAFKGAFYGSRMPCTCQCASVQGQ